LVKPGFLDRARAAPDGHPIYARGIIPHPAVTMPQPTPSFICTNEGGADDDGPEAARLCGHLFVDGSCEPHVIPELARASWSVVAVTRDGAITRIIKGLVPATLPQTAQAGEFMAYAVVTQLAEDDSYVWQDCMSVVKVALASFEVQTDPRRMHAGTLRWCRQQSGYHFVKDVEWVKAHESVPKNPDFSDMDQWKRWGNAKADSEAKLALGMHPQPSQAERDAANGDISDATMALLVITATWRCWPRLERYPRPVGPAKRRGRPGWPKLERRHHWEPFSAGLVRCCACLEVATAGSPDQHGGQCLRRSRVLTALASHSCSHKLVNLHAEDSRSVFVCYTCGKSAEQKVRHLRKPCCGPPEYGSWGALSLRRVAEGKHPSRPELHILGAAAFAASLRAAGYGRRRAVVAAASGAVLGAVAATHASSSPAIVRAEQTHRPSLPAKSAKQRIAELRLRVLAKAGT